MVWMIWILILLLRFCLIISIMSCSIFSSKKNLHPINSPHFPLHLLLEVFLTLFLSMNHNFSKFSDHFGKFAIGTNSVDIVQADDLFMQLSRESFVNQTPYFMRLRDRSCFGLNHPKTFIFLCYLNIKKIKLLSTFNTTERVFCVIR